MIRRANSWPENTTSKRLRTFDPAKRPETVQGVPPPPKQFEGQRLLFYAKRLELSVQRRALHANELGGSRYVAAKPTDLSHEIVALEGFSRLAKREAQQFLAANAARHRRHERADLGRKH